jgi:hypothetical protein
MTLCSRQLVPLGQCGSVKDATPGGIDAQLPNSGQPPRPVMRILCNGS